MENNEDKRQMTPISSMIADIENRILSVKERQDRHRHDTDETDFIIANIDLAKCEYAKRILESILTKEKESYIDFAKAYKTAVHYDPMIKSPRTVFNETFKPYK